MFWGDIRNNLDTSALYIYTPQPLINMVHYNMVLDITQVQLENGP